MSSITISAIAADNIINATEAGSALAVSGTTTSIEDNQIVTVGLNSQTYTATVTGGLWSLNVPQGDVAGLLDGTTPLVTADVSDLGGTPAPQATRGLVVDLSAPSITIDAISADNIVNALETLSALTVSGTTTAEDGQTVTVGLNSQTYTATVASGVWSLSVPQGDVAVLLDGTTPTVSADVSDLAGNPATQASQPLLVDLSAPSITIDAISADNIVNVLEAGSALTVSGTTTAEDGQTVTVGLNSQTYTATVASGVWSLSVPQGDVAALLDGTTPLVTADVSDLAGNPATQATRAMAVDLSAPSISIDAISADNIVSALETLSSLTVSGTTDAEDGQTVTVGLNSQTYTATVASGVWSLSVPQGDVAVLLDGTTPLVTAEVSDLAGNPATQATRALSVDLSAPSISIDAISADNIVSALEALSALTVSGTTTAEDGQTVTVGLNSQTYTATVASGVWSLSVPQGDVAVLLDGTTPTVSADVSDLAGNPATQATRVLSVDLSAPSISIDVISADNIVNALETLSSLTVSGTTDAEDGQTVTVGLNSQTYTATVASGVWSLSVPQGDVAALLDGTTPLVTADVSDLAGNPATQATQPLVVDLSAPSITIDAISTDNIIDGVEALSALTVSGTTTAEDGQTVTVGLNSQTYTATVASGVWSLSVPQVDVAALGDGTTPQVTADVSDLAGNPATQAMQGLLVDLSAPTITISPVASDDIINAVEAGFALTVSGTTSFIEDGQTVTVGLNSQTYTATVASGAWSLSVPQGDVAVLLDGTTPLVTADVSDLGGTPAQATQGLVVDLSAPSITIDAISADNIVNALETLSALTVSGTTTAEDGQTVTVGLNSQTYTATVASGVWSLSVPQGDVAVLLDGTTPTVSADVSDLAGNPATQATQPLVVDLSAPSISIDAISADNIVNALETLSSLTVSGTTDAEDGQTVTVGLNSQTYTATVASGVWSLLVPQADVAALPDGTSPTVSADVSDLAGNPALTATLPLAVDETASITIDPIATDDIVNASEVGSGLTITGTTTGVEGGQTVTVVLNGQTYTGLVGANLWQVDVPQVDVAGLPNGVGQTVSADVSDLAGNPAITATQGLAVDLSAPSITIDAISGDNVVNATETLSNLTVSGTTTGAEDGQTVTVGLNGQTYTTTVTAGAWTLDVPQGDVAALPDGANLPVSADVSDFAGNPAPTETKLLAVDLTAPSITMDAISTDNIVNAADANFGLTITGTTTGVEDGQAVTVVLNGQTYSGSVNGNLWHVDVAQGAVGGLPDGPLSVTADVSDLAGNPAATATTGVVVDLTAIITIDAISTDNIVNAAEAGSGLTITGTTTGVEDGQTVTVGLNGQTYSGTVNANLWHVDVPQGDVEGLPEGGGQTVSADVSDLVGNVATTATQVVSVDLTAPSITMDAISTDDIINATEVGFALTISGTTTAENGQMVTVGLNGQTYTGLVSASLWHVDVLPADLAGLANGANLPVTADVSDLAGNPATTATRGLAVDLVAPSITIDPISTDNVVNAAEAGFGLTITGTTTGAADGQVVTVGLNGQTYLATVILNFWQVDVPQGDVAGLPDAVGQTVAADVSDLAGNPATTATQALAVDLSAGITMDAISTDNVVNATEAGFGLTITGTTTGVEDGQSVTVVLNGQTYSGTVNANLWHVDVPQGAVAGLPDGVGQTVTADVSDLAGNPATTATQALAVDLLAPSITISPISTDNIVNLAEAGSGLIVDGTTTAEDGQTVTVGLNSQTYSATVAGGLWSLIVPPGDVGVLFDGTSPTVTADVSDVAGNPATQETQVLGVDFSAPSITIDPISTDNVVNALEAAAALTVSGTTTGAENGQTVTVGLNGKSYTGTVASNAWTVTISKGDVAALADGATLPVTADVSDLAGNQALQATQALEVDLTASITIDAISTDNIINAAETKSALTVSGTTTAEDNQTVTVGLNGQTYTTTVIGNLWTLDVPQLDVAALADGASLPVTADVSDLAGNPAPTATRALVVDLTAPSITIDPISTDNVVNAAEAKSALTVSGTTTAEDNQTVTVGLNGQTYTGTVASNTWTVTVSKSDVAALADGASLPVTAEVSDLAGNPPTTATRGVVVDLTAPSITIDAIATDNIVNAAESKSALTVSGTTTAEDNQTVTVGLNGKTYTGTVAGSAWTVTVSKSDVAAFTDGANLPVTADVSDLAGNPATTATQGLAVDLTASITIDAISTDNIVNAAEAKSGLTVSGTTTAEDNQTVTVGLNGKTYSGTVASNAWSVTVSKSDVAALTDGASLTVTADVSDLAGNPATQATHGLQIDETAPSITISALATDDNLDAAEAASPFTVAGTTSGAENGRTVTVGLNGKSYTTTVLNDAWTTSILAADLASVNLPDGGYTVIANVSDIAGNPAPEATRSLTVHEASPSITSPTITINPIAGDDILNALEATFPLSVAGTTGDVEDGQHVTIGLNGTNYDAVVSGGSWTASVAAADLAHAILPDGGYTVTADVADLAGRPAIQATRSLTVDQSQVVNNGPFVGLSNTMTSDVFFQHDGGAVAIWQLGGATLTASGQIGLNPGSDWHISGLADFFGNHDTDILWQNTDGSVAMWDMKGSAIVGGGIVALNPGNDWHARGTGNFFGRSTSDILWQNNDGTIAIWNMNGTNIATGQIVGFNPGPNWQVQGSGDFFRNGHSDILSQNTDGSVAIWDMLGSTIVGGGIVGFNPGPDWHIKGAGAFFGDGNTDIAWQNDDGSVALWSMNGTTIVGGGVVGLNPGPNWHLMGTGNFFANGNNSLLFQNDDGSVAVWGMNGTAIAVAGVVGPNLGSSWHAYGNDGMRFIDGTSGTGTLTATGQPDQFVLTPFVSGPHAIAGFDVGHDIIELSKSLFPAFADVQSHATNSGDGTLIDLGNSNSLLLQGIPLDSLHSNNFVLV